MSREQIKALAEKWMQGTLSAEERAIFERWYNHNEGGEVQWPGDETEEELRTRIYGQISTEWKEGGKSRSLVFARRWWRVAAAVLIIGAGSFAWYTIISRTPQPVVATAKPSVYEAPERSTGFIRHITLPDGTHVVLQANSRLDYPEKFIGKAREVVLSGEAYFDVAEDTRKPFIIYTGRVRTTVLGTAFNIRASPDDKNITVSVTKGRVKVEDDRRLLAVLSPNQRVTYQPVTAVLAKDTVNAISLVTDWTKHEMVFEGQTFEDVAALLSRRYGVDIRFKTDGLKKCTIKAFFNGTETLEKVLDVLCIINNATRSMPDEHTVLLDGVGCGG